MTKKSWQAHASAKLNLALHVTGQRPDGYHELDSLVVFARPGDVVTIRVAEADSFRISGRFAAVLAHDDDNLVLKASVSLLEYYSIRAHKIVSMVCTLIPPTHLTRCLGCKN